MSLQQHAGEGEGGGEGDDDGHVADGAETDQELSDNDVFEILRNSRRRVVISHLLAAEGPVPVRDLTKQVAAAEYDVDVDEVSPDQHKRVYTGLYQCHLPRLDEFDVIDFENDEKRVRPSDGAAQVETYLDRRNRDPDRVEVGVAMFVASLVLLGVLGVGPFGSVPVTAWATLTMGALLGFAVTRFFR